LQIERDGALRPRDIQARIRAGQSAEEIADEFGLPVEHVRRYEGPVLAEREFVVRQARAVRMRAITRFDGTVPTLGELVAERLAAREVEHGDGSWDSWRTDEGIWMVALNFAAGTRQRRACWSYDAQLRHVSPQDDEARWLTDAEPAGPGPGAAVHRRLVPLRTGAEPVQDHLYDVEEDGGIRPAEDTPTAPPWPAASTVDLLDSLRERRGRRQRPMPEGPEEAGADPDFLQAPRPTGLAPFPPPAHPAPSHPQDVTDAEVLALPDAPAPIAAPANHAEAAPPEPPQPPQQPTRRGKRASVPSWDDIVFGGRRE
jgi:hypothetical protein